MIKEKELDRVLQEIMTRWGIPGLGVGIVEDGEIVYARGFGVQGLLGQGGFLPADVMGVLDGGCLLRDWCALLPDIGCLAADWCVCLGVDPQGQVVPPTGGELGRRHVL